MDHLRQKLNRIAEACDGKVYEQYSGRGMYGRQCYGITTDYPDTCIEAAVENGIKGACTDSLGMQTIVYWPALREEGWSEGRL